MPSNQQKNISKDILFSDQDFPKTHALEDLVLLAAVKDPGCRKLFTLASEISPYAVEIRYPESSSPSVQDARGPVKIGKCDSDPCAGNDETHRITIPKREG